MNHSLLIQIIINLYYLCIAKVDSLLRLHAVNNTEIGRESHELIMTYEQESLFESLWKIAKALGTSPWEWSCFDLTLQQSSFVTCIWQLNKFNVKWARWMNQTTVNCVSHRIQKSCKLWGTPDEIIITLHGPIQSGCYFSFFLIFFLANVSDSLVLMPFRGLLRL